MGNHISQLFVFAFIAVQLALVASVPVNQNHIESSQVSAQTKNADVQVVSNVDSLKETPEFGWLH